MTKSTNDLEWEAHEYEHKERSADWFWVAGIIVAAIALASIIFGNIIFGILILISAFSLALFINRPPENVRVAIGDTGVRRNNVLYPFETLESFWIDTEHPHKKILIRSKKTLMPLIIVPLAGDTDVERLREYLLPRLSEEHHSLPLVEKILEYLGF